MNCTNMSNFQEGDCADDMFFDREIFVYVEIKISDSVGEGNGGFADGKRCR